MINTNSSLFIHIIKRFIFLCVLDEHRFRLRLRILALSADGFFPWPSVFQWHAVCAVNDLVNVIVRAANLTQEGCWGPMQ